MDGPPAFVWPHLWAVVQFSHLCMSGGLGNPILPARIFFQSAWPPASAPVMSRAFAQCTWCRRRRAKRQQQCKQQCVQRHGSSSTAGAGLGAPERADCAGGAAPPGQSWREQHRQRRGLQEGRQRCLVHPPEHVWSDPDALDFMSGCSRQMGGICSGCDNIMLRCGWLGIEWSESLLLASKPVT